MRRTGLYGPGTARYFDLHIKIDPHHTEDLIGAIEKMAPPLSEQDCRLILEGATRSIEATKFFYDHMLASLREA
jgi:hypothetical protein